MSLVKHIPLQNFADSNLLNQTRDIKFVVITADTIFIQVDLFLVLLNYFLHALWKDAEQVESDKSADAEKIGVRHAMVHLVNENVVQVALSEAWLTIV